MSTDQQKQVETILRLSENEQSENSVWAIARGYVKTLEQIHWWDRWDLLYALNESEPNMSTCGLVSRGDVVVGAGLKEALLVPQRLAGHLCEECCALFLDKR